MSEAFIFANYFSTLSIYYHWFEKHQQSQEAYVWLPILTLTSLITPSKSRVVVRRTAPTDPPSHGNFNSTSPSKVTQTSEIVSSFSGLIRTSNNWPANNATQPCSLNTSCWTWGSKIESIRLRVPPERNWSSITYTWLATTISSIFGRYSIWAPPEFPCSCSIITGFSSAVTLQRGSLFRHLSTLSLSPSQAERKTRTKRIAGIFTIVQ